MHAVDVLIINFVYSVSVLILLERCLSLITRNSRTRASEINFTHHKRIQPRRVYHYESRRLSV